MIGGRTDGDRGRAYAIGWRAIERLIEPEGTKGKVYDKEGQSGGKGRGTVEGEKGL